MENAEFSNKRLLTAVILGIGLLVIPAITIFQIIVHRHPVYMASVELIEGDATVQTELGRQIETGFWVNGRVWKGTASFRYRISGPVGTAEATVSAVERDSLWKVEYILLKQLDRRTLSLPGAKGYIVR